MANTKSAKKAIRTSEKNRQRNNHFKSRLKTLTNTALTLIDNQDANATSAVKEVLKAIDKTASKKIIPTKRADRKKSRIMKKLNATTLKKQPKNSIKETPKTKVPTKKITPKTKEK